MTKLSQVNAVIESVKSVVEVVPGVKVELSKEQRAQVIESLMFGFKDGAIEMSASAAAKYLTDDKALKTYVGGLLTNWLNKSKELNGGVSYEAKAPGSRTGSEEYKQALALKKYLTETGADIPAELEEFIATHAPVKVEAKKQLDLSHLPENLKQLVG